MPSGLADANSYYDISTFESMADASALCEWVIRARLTGVYVVPHYSLVNGTRCRQRQRRRKRMTIKTDRAVLPNIVKTRKRQF